MTQSSNGQPDDSQFDAFVYDAKTSDDVYMLVGARSASYMTDNGMTGPAVALTLMPPGRPHEDNKKIVIVFDQPSTQLNFGFSLVKDIVCDELAHAVHKILSDPHECKEEQ